MEKKARNKNSFQVTLPKEVTRIFWQDAAELQDSVPHLLRDLAIFYCQVRKEYPKSLGMREILLKAAGIPLLNGGSCNDSRRVEVTSKLIEDGAKLCKDRMKEVQKEMKKKGITPMTVGNFDYARVPTLGDEAQNKESRSNEL